MSTIEPTEEQKQAARDFMTAPPSGETVHAELARLLAEREAKLRGELHTERTVAEKALAARNDMENERDAARRDLARANGYLLAGQKSEMAMKGQLAEARARVAELEAFTLLTDSKREALRMVDEVAPPKFRAFDVTERPVAMDAVASCPKCSDDARPVSDGERWVCSVCRRPCRIPLNDTEGGEG